jgi:hypothetical protein
MKSRTLKYTSLAFSIAISTSANPAETIVNGVTVESKVTTMEFQCDGYSILIKQDQYPEEFNEVLERTNPALPGFLGDSITVSAKAFVKKDGLEHEVPDVTKKYQQSGRLLNDGRVYLPGLAYCLNKTAFVMSIWSGGNCAQCEFFMHYQINSEGKVLKISTPPIKELREITRRGIPNYKSY